MASGQLDLFGHVVAELGAELDNRRVQIWNSLRPAIEGAGKVSIVAFGNITSHVETIELANGRIYRPWPRPNPMSEGQHLSLVEWLQLRRGEYVFESEVDLGPSQHLSPAAQLIEVERTVSSDIAAISLGAGGALRWYTSRDPLPRPDSDSPRPGQIPPGPSMPTIGGSIITDKQAEFIRALSAALDSIEPALRDPLLGAMEWHYMGEGTSSLLVSFFCHWIAIERQAFWWFKHLGRTVSDQEFLNDLEKQQGVTVNKDHYTVSVTARSLKELVSRVSALNDKRNYTARRKIEDAFKHVFRGEAQRRIDSLFVPNEAGQKSLKNLRDDITHGNIYEVTVPNRFHIEGARYAISDLDRRFLIGSIARLTETN